MAYARIGYTYAVSWGQADKAKPYLERAFKLSSRLSEKDKLHLVGWYAIANCDWPVAIATMRDISANYPLESDAYSELGRLLRGEAQFEEAIEVFRQGLAIDPQSRDLHNSLGLIYSEQGRHDEGIAALQQYVALAPGLPNAHDSLGMGYQWTGRYDESIDSYDRALTLNPDFDIARVHLANTYYQQGRYREADEQFNRYIEVAPSDLERSRGYDSLALVYWRKGDDGRATISRRRAGEFHRTINLPTWMQLIAMADQGKLDAAEEFSQRLLEQRTTNNRGRRQGITWYYYFRGYTALKLGQHDAAVENFKEAIRQPPSVWVADPQEDCLANAYLELGRYDEAIVEYDRILKLNPNYPLVHYHLARIYELKGQLDKAHAEYTRFLEIWNNADPDVPEVLTARRKLLGA